MKTSTFVGSVLLLLVSSLLVEARDFYVDINGLGGVCSDRNPGTITQPWRTAIKGFRSARPGDTVYFREGTYRLTRAVLGSDFSRRAAKNSRITFKAYREEEAVITCMKVLNNPRHWVRETGQVYSASLIRQPDPRNIGVGRISNVSQDGIPLKLMTPYYENGAPGDLTGPGQWVRSVKTWKVYVWARGGGNPGDSQTEISEFPYGGSSTIGLYHNARSDYDEADWLKFENLIIEGGYTPLVVETDHVEIKGCTLRNCYGDAIQVGGAKPANRFNHDHSGEPGYFNSEYGGIEDCNIYNFGETGIDITGGDYWIVRNNRIHHNVSNRGYLISDKNPRGTSSSGLMFKNNCRGLLVEHNEIFALNLQAEAIAIGGQSWDGIVSEAVGVVVRDNYIHDIAARYVVLIMAAHQCSFSENLVYNCTLSEAIVRTGLSIRGYKLSHSRDCEITHNIFKGNKVARNYQYYCSRDSIEGLKADYNTIDPRKIYRFDGKDLTLDQFMKLGFEVNSITATSRRD
jgi:hypothetical protein